MTCLVELKLNALVPWLFDRLPLPELSTPPPTMKESPGGGGDNGVECEGGGKGRGGGCERKWMCQGVS